MAGRTRSGRRARRARATVFAVVALASISAPALWAAAAKPSVSRRTRIILRLDSVLNAINALQVPGYVVGVTGGHVGRFERAVGFADTSTNQKMTLNTHFRIGSISKTFTATVILKLVQSNALHLNDKLSTWEPGIPNANRITIKMLLNMTSGIWDEGGVGPEGQPSALTRYLLQQCYIHPDPTKCSQYFSPQQLVDRAIQDSQKYGPAYPPGVWYYSDTNYMILGIIAQRVTHTPLGLLLKRLLFEPLHLRHTSAPTHDLTIPSPAATGYRLDAVVAENKYTGYVPQLQPSPSTYFGAGNIVSTMHDLQVWAKALAAGRLLTPAMQRLRLRFVQAGGQYAPLAGTSPTIGLPIQYGLGIGVGGAMLGHSGLVPGYMSEMWYLPRVRGTIVALFNSVTPCIGGDNVGDAGFASLAQNAFGGSLRRTGLTAPNTCLQPGDPITTSTTRPPGISH